LKKKEIKALVSLLDDPDWSVFEQVKDKILSLGNDIVQTLESEWGNNLNPLVQERIETLIYELQVEQRMARFMEWKNADEQDLIKGLWLVCTIQYPDYEYVELRKELDALFLEVWQKYDINAQGRNAVAELNQILFNELKFSANSKHFHSPENSMLKSVLVTKRGNPISLCMVYLIIAQRLKIPVQGVNLPNLFVLTYLDHEEQFYINAFNKGLIFTRKDIESYVTQLNLERKDIFFMPCNNLEIIQRFLRNLIVAYDKNGQPEKKEEVRNILLFLND
jgi:regulator of sirC expression with transglutaminase-like and TPR domain